MIINLEMTCCKEMVHAMALGRVSKSEYDNQWYVWCEDCGRHEGTVAKFCHYCGEKLLT